MGLGFLLAIKGIIAIIVAIFHFRVGKPLKGLLLAVALWILIPGVDEMITIPLIAMMGLPLVPVLVIYYAIGVIALLLYLRL